jgi:YVTN family beta-propeller protein
VFVSNALSGSVSVISDESNTVVATVTGLTGPLGLAYDSDKGEIFVVNSSHNTVSVISDSTNTVIATINVGSKPYGIAYDSGKGELFVSNHDSNTVSIISDTTNAEVANVTVGGQPYGVVYDSNLGEVFVTNAQDGTVSVISDGSNTSKPSNPSSSNSTTPSNPSNPNSTSPSTPSLAEQVWVPPPANAVASVGVSAVLIGAVSLVFAALSNPLGGVGGALAEKTKDLIPDKIKDWLQEVISSRRKVNAVEKTGSRFIPTKTETIAYIVSIIVLAVSFSYVKVITLEQMLELLPVFFATSILVGFVQKFFSIVYLRSKGVWSELKIWPFGLVLFLFTTFAFKAPFSSPTRSAHSSKFTERLGAISAASEILIGLGFAGIFFLLLDAGYAAVGGAGLAMCVIGAFVGTFPVAPMSGKDIFDHSKRLWAGLFLATMVVFAAWLLLL